MDPDAHPPRSLLNVMHALAAVQLRWCYGWVVFRLIVISGGALWLTVFSFRALAAALSGSPQVAARLAVFAAGGAGVAWLAASAATRLALVSVVRRRARRLVARLPLTSETAEHLAFAAAGQIARDRCELDLVPVEALVIARDETVAAAAGRLGLDESRLSALVLLCQIWPGRGGALASTLRGLDEDRLRTLLALAPVWSLPLEELVALTGDL